MNIRPPNYRSVGASDCKTYYQELTIFIFPAPYDPLVVEKTGGMIVYTDLSLTL